MKKKKIAILLSAAVVVTSLPLNTVVTFANENSQDGFVSEETEINEVSQNEENQENTDEIENEGFDSEENTAEGFVDDIFSGESDILVEETTGTGVEINEDNFPDELFRKYVKEDADINEDGILSEDEAAAVTKLDDLYDENITSLQGIEYFTNLEYLYCYECALGELDVSHNTALKELKCGYNEISALDIRNNTELEVLECEGNSIKELDTSNNRKLTILDCDYNQLKILDLTNNKELRKLSCSKNQLTALNLNEQLQLGADKEEAEWKENLEYAQSDYYFIQAVGNENSGWAADLGALIGNENISKINKLGSSTGWNRIENDIDSWDVTHIQVKDGILNWDYNYEPKYIYMLIDTGYVGKYYGSINLKVVFPVVCKESQTPALEDDNFVYENNEDGTLAVIKYKGTEKDVVIPETFNGKKVTQIRAGEEMGVYGVFAGKNITSVSMPSIELVGFQAFNNCSDLKTAYMPNLKRVGLSAFAGSGLVSVDAPLLTVINPNSFSDCINLTSVNMPALTQISQYGFSGCKNLKELIGSESITKLVYGALNDTGLTSIRLRGNVELSSGHPFGYCTDETGQSNPVDGFVVYGEKGTTVEEYAKANGFEFIEIGSEQDVCNHQWEEVVEAATCTKDGISYKKCKLCGEKSSEKVLPATGHKTSFKNLKNATCTENGYTGDKICDICGSVLKKGKAIPATGHKTTVKNQKNATCTETGYTGDKICENCGTTVEKGKDIPAIGHKYGEYKLTKAATIFENGMEIRECTVCKTTETREIAKLPSSVQLNVKTLPLQVKKSVSVQKLIASMETGDSIAALKTSNEKVAAVNNESFKITAKKAGKTTITVTLKSGATADFTVNVKKGKIPTTKISGIQKTITLKKGKKLTLKPVLSPITSTDKITYSTSNKKIATVSAKGVVKGIKKGKVTIKVKAGKKTVTCKVTVK